LAHDTKTAKNAPNAHKIYQTVNNYPNRRQNITDGSTFSNQRRSKIYPNWDFWLENEPSGNPGTASRAEECGNKFRSENSK
jgi:hypothetical protein